LRLLEQNPDPFYEAKARRHLGVIARREKRYDDARGHYEAAAKRAQDISNNHEALAMKAGLQYALASLAFHERRLEDAAKEIEAAITSFRTLDDEYRLNMALVARGDIEFERGDTDDARDTYRYVLQHADRNKETLQYVRACLGLAATRAADCQWAEVRKVLELLNGLDLQQYKAEQDRLASLRAKLPTPA
jgi:tetratricopeptide (TPR) repeat protein